MNEFTPTSDNEKKKTKTLQIIIAILAVIALVQAFVLFSQRFHPAETKKQALAAATPISPHAPHRVATAHFADPWGSDPFEEFDAVSRHMSNVMRQVYMMSAPFMRSAEPSSGFDFSPAVDLQETDNAYIIQSDLPGLDKDKINVTVRNNILTLEGMRETSNETQDPKKGYYSQERSYGSFSRSLSLPGPVDEAKISANYKNGVLTITLPKTAPSKDSQRVSIQ